MGSRSGGFRLSAFSCITRFPASEKTGGKSLLFGTTFSFFGQKAEAEAVPYRLSVEGLLILSTSGEKDAALSASGPSVRLTCQLFLERLTGPGRSS